MGKYKCSLLVVDDEPYILATLRSLLNPEFEVIAADSGAAAQREFARRDIDIILSDQKMPQMSGIQLLEWVHSNHPKTVRLLMTGFAELEEAVEAINRGQVFRYILKPWRPEELQAILSNAARTFNLERSHEQLLEQYRQLNMELEERVAQRTKELEEANHELEQKNKMLERLAMTDTLTSLPNRRAMDRLAQRELRLRDRYPGPISLAIIDVDHFKEINARHKLPGGDKVLIDLGKALFSSLRNVDHLGRIGGEEFLVVAPKTGMEGAKILGERIRSTVEKTIFTYKDPFTHEEAIIPVRVSIGFAVDEGGEPGSAKPDYEIMRDTAAAALEEAKKTGRNKCIFYRVANFPFEAAG